MRLRAYKILCACLLALSACQAAYIVWHAHPEAQQQYPLLSPAIAQQSIDDFAAHQQTVRVSYNSLRPALLSILNETNSTYSIYFEDLQSGATVAINADALYLPKSLFKVPTAIAVLKSIEEGDLQLSSQVTLQPDMFDSSFGSLYTKGPGYKITVAELLNLSLTESDNTANNALRSAVPFAKIEEARLRHRHPVSEEPECKL